MIKEFKYGDTGKRVNGILSTYHYPRDFFT